MKKLLFLSAGLATAMSCVNDSTTKTGSTEEEDNSSNSATPPTVTDIPDGMNILYIMTDQQNYNMMSCMGNSYLSTPGMDSIAENGYKFTNNYCANPVSMPSRFTLATGMPASSVGVRGNSDDYDESMVAEYTKNSLANLFNAAGYETRYSGKTHFYAATSYYGWGEVFTKDAYEEGCQMAVDYLNSRSAVAEADKKPFFLFVSLMNPHDICYDAGFDSRYPDDLDPEQVEATMYYLEQVYANLTPEEYAVQVPPRMPNEEFMICDPSDSDMPDPENLKTSGCDYRTWSEEQQDLFRWMYYRLTESVDGLIVRVLAALEASGEKENTLIVFTSDHGELLGAHGYTTKSLLFNEPQKVPFIFSGPGVQQGVTDSETLTCNGYDLLPTLCDFVGIEWPEYLPGISLKPLLGGDTENQATRDYIITECSSAVQITDGVNKLTMFDTSGNPRIFSNLDEDPNETINMLKYSSHARIIAQFQPILDEYIQGIDFTE